MSTANSERLAQSSLVEPVYSEKGRHKVYLVLRRSGDRVRVEPTQLGKSALPSFWTMWLRQLILRHGDTEYSFGVELNGNHIIVSGSTATYEGLKATVGQLAARIAPAIGSPLIWHRPNPTDPNVNYSVWKIKERSGLTEEVLRNRLKGFKLPKGTAIYYWDESDWRETPRGNRGGFEYIDYPFVTSFPSSARQRTVSQCVPLDARHQFGSNWPGLALIRETRTLLSLREMRLMIEMHVTGVQL